MSSIFGWCPVSNVSATAGCAGATWRFCAFFAVHMTICEPFQTKPIGMFRGVTVLGDVGQSCKSRGPAAPFSDLAPQTSATSLGSMISASFGLAFKARVMPRRRQPEQPALNDEGKRRGTLAD